MEKDKFIKPSVPSSTLNQSPPNKRTIPKEASVQSRFGPSSITSIPNAKRSDSGAINSPLYPRQRSLNDEEPSFPQKTDGHAHTRTESLTACCPTLKRHLKLPSYCNRRSGVALDRRTTTITHERAQWYVISRRARD